MKRVPKKNKKAASLDDTLSTIQNPKYDYNPLDLVTVKRARLLQPSKSNAAKPQMVENSPEMQKSSTQSSFVESSRNYLVEEYSSDELNTQGSKNTL